MSCDRCGGKNGSSFLDVLDNSDDFHEFLIEYGIVSWSSLCVCNLCSKCQDLVDCPLCGGDIIVV